MKDEIIESAWNRLQTMDYANAKKLLPIINNHLVNKPFPKRDVDDEVNAIRESYFNLKQQDFDTTRLLYPIVKSRLNSLLKIQQASNMQYMNAQAKQKKASWDVIVKALKFQNPTWTDNHIARLLRDIE